MPLPTAGSVNPIGLDASGHADLASHWGVTLDTSYVRASDVLSVSVRGSTELTCEPARAHATRMIQLRYKRRKLILRINWTGFARWRIGDRTNIGDQRLDV
jgi:hypothetical protein